MSDKRPLYEQAHKDYIKGLSNKEIAHKYQVSESTVRSWKNRYWSKEVLQQTRGNVATKNKNVATGKKLKRGAQPNNKNAVGNSGGGAPKGNKNNWKHGIYEKLLFETLSDDEKELLLDLDIDEEKELKMTLRLYDTKIIRLNLLIKNTMEKSSTLNIGGISKKEEYDSEKLISKSITTDTISSSDLILRYENEIQTYTRQKVRCLETLIKLGFDRYKLELDLIKTQSLVKVSDTPEQNSSNFIEALQDAASGEWLND